MAMRTLCGVQTHGIFPPPNGRWVRVRCRVSERNAGSIPRCGRAVFPIIVGVARRRETGEEKTAQPPVH